LARAELTESGLDELAESVLRWQRELFVVGADLAANPDARDRLEDGTTRVSEAMLEGVEVELALWEAAVEMPREFIVPGETRASAALEMARVILRRAERRAITAEREAPSGSAWIVPYLNRLADLLWVLARAAEQAVGAPVTTARVR
jgi:cob(I)alamin adenosyltransferase